MFKRFLFPVMIATVVLPPIQAQDTPTAVTRTSRFLNHFDLGISGTAFFTKGVTGNVNESVLGPPYPITQTASTAAGAIATIRGQKSAYKGLEFNYSYGRVTESYTCQSSSLHCNQGTTTGTYVGPFQSQATPSEYTFGYLVRPERTYFGFKPYISGGAGVMEFKPTQNGGQGLQTQARAAYYYSIGGEEYLVGDTLGLRVGFRQVFFKAPDFGQNYLTILKTTFVSEPQVGLFLHF